MPVEKWEQRNTPNLRWRQWADWSYLEPHSSDSSNMMKITWTQSRGWKSPRRWFPRVKNPNVLALQWTSFGKRFAQCLKNTRLPLAGNYRTKDWYFPLWRVFKEEFIFYIILLLWRRLVTFDRLWCECVFQSAWQLQVCFFFCCCFFDTVSTVCTQLYTQVPRW